MTEVATFRSDGVYSDGRHPDEVRYTKTAAEDVQRRDFTINGLFCSIRLIGQSVDSSSITGRMRPSSHRNLVPL